MVMEALVYILTLLFGVSTVIIIKNKRYKVVPFICLDIILTFAGFAITSFVILFVRNEALEALLIMSVFGLFLFLLGVNDIYAVFCCNQKIEAIYCGYNSYPGRYGITSYAPVFEYVCNGTAYHEQITLTGTAEIGKSVETLRFAEMLSSFAQIPGDVDSAAWR